jgi:cell division protein FtsL
VKKIPEQSVDKHENMCYTKSRTREQMCKKRMVCMGSIITLILIALFGFGVVAAAFHAERLISWENRAINMAADRLQAHREALEAEDALLSAGEALAPVLRAVEPAQPSVRVARKNVNRGKAA